MVTTPTILSSAEWTGILFDCFLFELSGKYPSDNNECNIAHISNALLIAWHIHKHKPNLFNCPFNYSLVKKDLITSNIKQYINTTRRYTYSIFPHQLSASTRHIPYRIVGTNKQGVSIKEFVSLPSLSSPDTQTFFDRYAVLVPSQYHDDFATLVLCLRVAFWKNGGSGGLTCLLSNGVEGVTKFSKRHNDKKRKRLTNTRFPPGELERLRLTARKLQTDAEERQNQELARLEALKKEQQEILQKRELARLKALKQKQGWKRQQVNLRILQERVKAARLEAVRFEAERLEAERLEAERLKAERLEAERLEEQRQLRERQEKEEHQRLELARLQALKKEQEERQQQEYLRILQEQLKAMQLEETRTEEQRQLKEKQETEEQQRQKSQRLEALKMEEEIRQQEKLPILQEQLEETRLKEQGPLTEKLGKKKWNQRDDIITKYLGSLQTALKSTRINNRDVGTLRQILQENLQRYTDAPTITVHLIGSFESGLSTINSDADFTVFNFAQPYLGGTPIEELAKALRWAGCQSVITIASARVPIVKFVAWDVQCDMSMDQPMGVINSNLISAYRKIDNRFLTLWFAIRHIAWKHKILSGGAGYLSSYALTMMLIVFLQNVTSPPILPRLQQQDRCLMKEHDIDGYDCAYDHDRTHYRVFGNANTKQAAQLLMDFCQFYGYTFDYSTQEVNTCLGVIKARSYDPPPRSEWDQRPKDWSLCVLDPFITGRNVAGNCRESNLAEIQKCFRDSFDALSAGDIRTAFKPKFKKLSKG